jgi:hypothetical protein
VQIAGAVDCKFHARSAFTSTRPRIGHEIVHVSILEERPEYSLPSLHVPLPHPNSIRAGGKTDEREIEVRGFSSEKPLTNLSDIHIRLAMCILLQKFELAHQRLPLPKHSWQP